MKAAVVREAGKPPVYADFPEPDPAPGERIISVTASALSHLARGRASGTHYSASGQFPFVAGVDGVGRLDDGTRVYFLLPRAPYGAMAERVAVAASQIVPLPEGMDEAAAAAIANPGMSSWAAYSERARLKPGETVMVNGAAGTGGRLAVQIAKHFGAKTVIAVARNAAALAEVEALGADKTIALGEDSDALDAALREAFAGGVDVVIDYLWGQSAERILAAAAKAAPDIRPIRFVQIGAVSGADIHLPAAALRAKAIELMGSGLGSVAPARLLHAIGEVLRAAGPAGLDIAFKKTPLADVERAWGENESTQRTVFTLA